MLGEDDYYLGKGDLFFPLRNYLPDRTATKRIFLFYRRRRGQFESEPVKWRAGWQLRLGELSIGKIRACAKKGARDMDTRASERRIGRAFLDRLVSRPNPLWISRRRVGQAFLGQLVFGLFPFEALGSG